MHQRKSTKHPTTGTTQDYHIFVTYWAYWFRLLASGHIYKWFSVLDGHNKSFYKIHSGLPQRNKETKTAVTNLFNVYILRFGTPGKILHDQGREFESKLFTQLSQLCNIKRLRTKSYHPQCNGQVERMNKLIIAILKTLEETEKKSWKDHVQRCAKHSSTSYALFFLLFGLKPRLPIDLLLEPTNKTIQDTHSNSVDD